MKEDITRRIMSPYQFVDENQMTLLLLSTKIKDL
jgi:hypothetical protein